MDFTKNAEYYEQLDKRTKEYKEYKEWADKQSKGLGDTIDKITTKTGVKKAVEATAEALGFDDCGCESRRDLLNKLFRWKRPKCLEESEYLYLAEWFDKNKNVITGEEQQRLLNIYNRVFDENRSPSNCPACVREVSNRLKKLMEAHKK